MTKLKKCFGEINMSWLKVIILAIASAVFTAAVNLIPALKGTSFQDIAVNLECWILFAVFIISNCKKWWEASLKCFVFFLISQPLIYLIEVPFVHDGWDIFRYYKYWAVITVLTLPGAIVAYQLKRKDWLSVAVLSVANGYLAYQSVKYLRSALSDFPHHLLSAVFCVALAVMFILIFFDKKIYRIVSLAVIALVMAGTFIYTIPKSKEVSLGEGEWVCEIEDESVVSVEMSDGSAVISPEHKGSTYVRFRSSDGTLKEFYATVSGGDVWVDSLE